MIFDRLGPTLTFLLDVNESKIRTYFGVIMTLILIVLGITLTVIMSQDFFLRRNPQIVQNNIFNIDKKYTVNNSNLFFAILIESENKKISSKINEYVKFQARVYNYNSSTDEYNMTAIDIRQCDQIYHKNDYTITFMDNIDLISNSNSHCLMLNNITLGGMFLSESTTFIDIEIISVIDETSNRLLLDKANKQNSKNDHYKFKRKRNSCRRKHHYRSLIGESKTENLEKDSEDIDDILTALDQSYDNMSYITIFYPQAVIKIEDYTNGLDIFPTIISYGLDFYTYKSILIFLNEVTLETDIGWLFTYKTKVEQRFDILNISSDTVMLKYFNSDGKHLLGSVSLYIGPNNRKNLRISPKFQKMLAEIISILNLGVFFAAIIISIYNKSYLKLKLYLNKQCILQLSSSNDHIEQRSNVKMMKPDDYQNIKSESNQLKNFKSSHRVNNNEDDNKIWNFERNKSQLGHVYQKVLAHPTILHNDLLNNSKKRESESKDIIIPFKTSNFLKRGNQNTVKILNSEFDKESDISDKINESLVYQVSKQNSLINKNHFISKKRRNSMPNSNSIRKDQKLLDIFDMNNQLKEERPRIFNRVCKNFEFYKTNIDLLDSKNKNLSVVKSQNKLSEFKSFFLIFKFSLYNLGIRIDSSYSKMFKEANSYFYKIFGVDKQTKFS